LSIPLTPQDRFKGLSLAHASSFILIIKNAFSIFKFLIAVFYLPNKSLKTLSRSGLDHRRFDRLHSRKLF
ncbi:hypothetical protein, partial [Helicobacter pylori]|uniref:hypothetical protein n=1 Tax=Helicobacter pylori TaxID=210 RepID=UPI001F529705